MTENTQEVQVTQTQATDKEINFRRQQQMYEKKLEEERQARIQLEQELQRFKTTTISEEEDDDAEPYVDKRKLNKALDRFNQKAKQETQQTIQQAVHQAIEQDRRDRWLETNSDFQEVMSHADKLAEINPEIARTILAMPESFERQKLVYHNIKMLGVHKPKAPEQSIQQKIDQNRRSPYYQPSGVGSAPYAAAGDFSKAGQESAFSKMRELQSRLRLG